MIEQITAASAAVLTLFTKYDKPAKERCLKAGFHIVSLPPWVQFVSALTLPALVLDNLTRQAQLSKALQVRTAAHQLHSVRLICLAECVKVSPQRHCPAVCAYVFEDH